MRTKLSIAILLIFLVGVDVILYVDKQTPATQAVGQTSVGSETTNPQVPTTQPVAIPSGGASYTLADVAKHPDGTSCWTAINGKVYDVTSWINQHPGGPEAILSICGVDGSAAFNGQHGGERRPANELATFLIGTLE